MSVEIRSRNLTGFFRNRSIFVTRTARRNNDNAARAAQDGHTAVQPAGAMFQGAQNTRIEAATFNIFSSRSSGDDSSTNPAGIRQVLPSGTSPPLLETATTQATRDNPTHIVRDFPVYESARQNSPPTPSEVYRDCLQRQGYGHPLWIPGPNERLSEHYRESGVMFGDVGVITSHGSFLYLFSIVHQASHPRNSGVQLPPNFVPFAASPDECEVEEFREFDGDTGSYVADDSVMRVDAGEDRLKTTFQTSARKAAILALPETVYTVSMVAVVALRDYVGTHSKDWYTFARKVKGWDVKNGDIRVVHTSRKSSGYGIAAVRNGAPEPTTELLFSVDEAWADGGQSCRYRWTHKGCATVKAGPSVTLGGRQVANQCLFIGTIDSKLGDVQWKAVEHGDGPLVSRSKDQSCDLSATPYTQPGDEGKLSTGDPSASNSASMPPSSQLSMENMTGDDEHLAENTVIIPSDILTDFLLRVVPNVAFVSVSTEDWGPYYTDSTQDIYEFLDNVLSANTICEDNDVVYLEKKVQTFPTTTREAFIQAEIQQNCTAPTFQSNVTRAASAIVAIYLEEVSDVISSLDRVRFHTSATTPIHLEALIQRVKSFKEDISKQVTVAPMDENHFGVLRDIIHGIDSLVEDLLKAAQLYKKNSRRHTESLTTETAENLSNTYQRRVDALRSQFQSYHQSLPQNFDQNSEHDTVEAPHGFTTGIYSEPKENDSAMESDHENTSEACPAACLHTDGIDSTSERFVFGHSGSGGANDWSQYAPQVNPSKQPPDFDLGRETHSNSLLSTLREPSATPVVVMNDYSPDLPMRITDIESEAYDDTSLRHAIREIFSPTIPTGLLFGSTPLPWTHLDNKRGYNERGLMIEDFGTKLSILTVTAEPNLDEAEPLSPCFSVSTAPSSPGVMTPLERRLTTTSPMCRVRVMTSVPQFDQTEFLSPSLDVSTAPSSPGTVIAVQRRPATLVMARFSNVVSQVDPAETMPSPSLSFSVSNIPSSPGVITPPPLGSGSHYESNQVPLTEPDFHPGTIPSPLLSVSDIPSSPRAITPPPLDSGSHYESNQVPIIEADIHPWLRINVAGPTFNNFDLEYPASHIPGTFNYVPPDALRQPATVPPVSSMRITCALMPWPVNVKSRTAAFQFVTINDVFSMIYTSLRTGVSGQEFSALLPTKAGQDAVSMAFRARCERAGPTGYNMEKGKGLKRVDFLLGRTRLCGLVAVNMGLKGWVLEVS